MYRSFFSFFVFIFISILTFLISKYSINYIKSIDPVMIEIKKNSFLYESSFVNAYINDEIIIPGISGKVIDFDSSFKLMKNYGGYNSNLLIYSDVSPKITISNIYDKYIVSGNKNKKEVSFVFKVEDTNYLEEIVLILNKNNIIGTFFVSDYVVYERFDILKFLYLNNQNIESLGSNSSYDLLKIDKFNYLLKSYFNKSINYCYSDSYNKEVLDICAKKKLHTIIPSLIIDKYPFHNIKYNLSNGLIINFNNRELLLNELNYIISYVKQMGYKIVSLEKLLEE